MPKNDYSKRREIKELIKSEIKGNISEFGPLSTLQGIAGGILDKIATKSKRAVSMSYDKEIAAAKG